MPAITATIVQTVAILVTLLVGRFDPSFAAWGQIDEADLGHLKGTLVSMAGDRVNAGKATVFICDAASGLPVSRSNKRPIRPTLAEPQLDELWWAETDDRGAFEFSDVLVGTYRLVAQSWSGTERFPGFKPGLQPSAFVFLHGVCEDVEVKAGEWTFVSIRQLGNRSLRIENDPAEAHALLLISLKPTLGDGILGPIGWGNEFRQHLIGATQMEVPFVTICGLPEDQAVHLGLMNYDNNPGFGAASFDASQEKGVLRIIASWSNGHKDPPPELAELVEYLSTNEITVDRMCAENDWALSGDGRDAQRVLVTELLENNDATIKIRGRGEERLADIIAALGYLHLRKNAR